MKKLILTSLLALSVSAMGAVSEGVGSGYKDEIKVSVETEGDKIVAIKVLKMDETKRIAEPAIQKLTEEIIAQQKVDVDNVAGATYTSLGFKEAVNNAIANGK
ncbi:FMN-binding protein [Fusobacterium sp.]|uniref:FMN-binding protein n=1 Tax=Fusobacterium sp. TaxID=68766 RepID=UPI00396CBDA6